MSKYEPLWEYIAEKNENENIITFNEIENILGFPIDHSFLRSKKEIEQYGYVVGKISMKEQKVNIKKLK